MRRSSVANLNPSLRSFYLFSRRSLLYHIFWNNLKFVCMAGEPPSKRSKKEIAETSENGADDDNILATYMAKRQNVCESVADFKFDKKRVRLITSNADMSETCKGIAYWMWREQRVQDNWALLYAQRMALKQEVPLIVCFCLPSKYLDAAFRQYSFMIKGLQEVEKELTELNIAFHMLLGEPDKVLPDFVKSKEIGGVVTDFTPMRKPLKWLEDVAEKLPKDVPVCQVDGHNIVPCWQASPKLEYGARTIRPKIHNQLKQFLTKFPPVVKHPYTAKHEAKTVDWKAVDKFIEVDHSVKDVDWAKPGTKAGLEMLESFCHERLKYFATDRNNPTKNAVSNLSPWFHAGQISVQRAILRVREFRSKAKDSVEAFIEEAVVRRELADNFCFYNLDHYDSIKGTNEWAQKTLQDHAQDKREYLYTREQLENGDTHDDLWNAAQLQLVNEGKMHGFLRMYWAKKILEWTASPEEALEVSLYFNDKFSLDGNDPNGYVGCMWSVCGVHDQGWAERPVFGKIRYMNYNGCKRKFDVPEFVRRYGTPKQKGTATTIKRPANKKPKGK
ncbi:deoxyribodipyrimidine photo-lyase-like isoform X2 [Oculina patagonica]